MNAQPSRCPGNRFGQSVIAIHPDAYGPNDASSPRWAAALERAGCTVRWVDVRRADTIEQLRGCDGFMWRHGHLPEHRQIARRLLPVIERELGLAVYPDQKTCWHYDDKVAQAYLFAALGIPTPRTWVWFDRDGALAWSRAVSYPMVIKLWAGAASDNVRLVRDPIEAERWIHSLFGPGVHGLKDGPPPAWPLSLVRLRYALRLARRGYPPPAQPPGRWWELHKDYVLFQEFLPNNDYDTRVTVIGDRAFGFRRMNREADFRASGSGRIDYDPSGVAPAFVRLAFDAANKLRAQSCAIDGLWRGSEPVVGEVSYTYVSWAVQQCPGHWDRELNWHEGHMWPEEAQVEDFLARLHGLRGAL